MQTKTDFSAEQQSAIEVLEKAFAASKASGLPLSVYSGDVSVVFPTEEQSKAIDIVRKAAKKAEKARLELRIDDKYPLVVDLINTTADALPLIY